MIWIFLILLSFPSFTVINQTRTGIFVEGQYSSLPIYVNGTLRYILNITYPDSAVIGKTIAIKIKVNNTFVPSDVSDVFTNPFTAENYKNAPLIPFGQILLHTNASLFNNTLFYVRNNYTISGGGVHHCANYPSLSLVCANSSFAPASPLDASPFLVDKYFSEGTFKSRYAGEEIHPPANLSGVVLERINITYINLTGGEEFLVVNYTLNLTPEMEETINITIPDNANPNNFQLNFTVEATPHILLFVQESGYVGIFHSFVETSSTGGNSDTATIKVKVPAYCRLHDKRHHIEIYPNMITPPVIFFLGDKEEVYNLTLECKDEDGDWEEEVNLPFTIYKGETLKWQISDVDVKEKDTNYTLFRRTSMEEYASNNVTDLKAKYLNFSLEVNDDKDEPKYITLNLTRWMEEAELNDKVRFTIPVEITTEPSGYNQEVEQTMIFTFDVVTPVCKIYV